LSGKLSETSACTRADLYGYKVWYALQFCFYLQ
jgi:hypothetical protein